MRWVRAGVAWSWRGRLHRGLFRLRNDAVGCLVFLDLGACQDKVLETGLEAVVIVFYLKMGMRFL